MDRPAVRRFDIQRIARGRSERMVDEVAMEEPLQIYVRYWFKETQHTEPFALAMRTPGSDPELAAGLLLSERVIRTKQDLVEVRALGAKPSNELLVELSPECDYDASRLARHGYVNSSCGICGTRSRELLAEGLPHLEHGSLQFHHGQIASLPETLRTVQAGFAATGGLHAAALVSAAGQIEKAFEDIGRHNALDKLIGSCLLEDQLPLKNHLLLMSSRTSFELVQKALMAGAPVLAAIGGPSSLAIELAREHGLTLLGFVRANHFNVYAGDWRVHSKQDEVALSRE